jgi:hypothetical protein
MSFVNRIFMCVICMLVAILPHLGNAMELSTNAVSSTNEISAFTTPSPVVEKTAGFCPSWDVKTTDVIAAMQIDGATKLLVNNARELGLRFVYMDIGLYGFKGGSSMTALESKVTDPEYINYLLHGLENTKNSTLADLALGTIFQSSIGCLKGVIKNSSKLEKLELRCGRQLSTSRYMGEVFNAIQGSSLKIVTVENACIVGGASDALYELFKKNKSLESLTLKECKVPFKSLPDLMNSLSKHPSLRALALRGNKSPMKLEVAHCLAKGLIKIAKNKSCSLVQVDLSDNKLDDNFVNTMINILTKAWLEDWPIKIILSGNPM